MIRLDTIPSRPIVSRCIAGGWRAAFALALAVAAPTHGLAQNAGDDPFAPLAKLLHQRTDEPPAPDFVRRSRPARPLQYVPVNGPRPQPRGKVMTRDEIIAAEGALQAARARQDKLAGRRAPPGPTQSAAGDPYQPKKKKEPPKCLLTCEIK